MLSGRKAGSERGRLNRRPRALGADAVAGAAQGRTRRSAADASPRRTVKHVLALAPLAADNRNGCWFASGLQEART